MTQSKLESLIEVVINIGSGLLLAAFVIQPIIFPWYDIEMSTSQNITMASVFTAVSVIRGYIWRRLFNDGSLHKNIHHIVNKIKKKRIIDNT